MKICAECYNCNMIEQDRSGIRYIYKCEALGAMKKPVIDPVSGKIKYRGSDGELSDDPYPYCREINDGNCDFWESKR